MQPTQDMQTPAQNTQQPIPLTTVQMPENPGQTLGIVSLITGFMGLGLIGIITGIMGLMKSKHAGQKNTFAIIGIIVSVISMIIVTLLIVLVFFGAKGMIEKCRELGPGTHQVGKSTYTCNINGSTEIKSNSFNE